VGLLNKFRKDSRKKDYPKEVMDNLIALFNTKESYGSWQKGLGLDSYSNIFSRNDLIKAIIADITYNIEHFEKRIKLIDIQAVKDDNLLILSFQIQCLIGKQFHSFYVGFNPHQNPIQVEVLT
jgi:predicted component of type VI protein secretion system